MDTLKLRAVNTWWDLTHNSRTSPLLEENEEIKNYVIIKFSFFFRIIFLRSSRCPLNLIRFWRKVEEWEIILIWKLLNNFSGGFSSIDFLCFLEESLDVCETCSIRFLEISLYVALDACLKSTFRGLPAIVSYVKNFDSQK